MSSRIRCGLNDGDLVERVLPVDGDGRLDVEAGEIRLEQLDVRLVVVGDQDATFFLAFGHAELDSDVRLPRTNCTDGHRDALKSIRIS